MRTYDLAPLYRATVGFDRLARLLENSAGVDQSAGYPPYNIEKLGEDKYRIAIAVAGFGEEDLDVTVKEGSLVVTGKKSKLDESDNGSFLHRGIAQRAFERRFDLADHIKVVGAALANGLLHVDLVREIPETLKPRTVKIETAPKAQPQVIDARAA